ncbi:universal stress protein [Streptomyces chiangmaiensis]
MDALLQDSAPESPGVRVNRYPVEGLACKVLVSRSAAADLLIIGVRRRRGHVGLQLGTAAHVVLHHAQCPVAVVPELP